MHMSCRRRSPPEPTPSGCHKGQAGPGSSPGAAEGPASKLRHAGLRKSRRSPSTRSAARRRWRHSSSDDCHRHHSRSRCLLPRSPAGGAGQRPAGGCSWRAGRGGGLGGGGGSRSLAGACRWGPGLGWRGLNVEIVPVSRFMLPGGAKPGGRLRAVDFLPARPPLRTAGIRASNRYTSGPAAPSRAGAARRAGSRMWRAATAGGTALRDWSDPTRLGLPSLCALFHTNSCLGRDCVMAFKAAAALFGTMAIGSGRTGTAHIAHAPGQVEGQAWHGLCSHQHGEQQPQVCSIVAGVKSTCQQSRGAALVHGGKAPCLAQWSAAAVRPALVGHHPDLPTFQQGWQELTLLPRTSFCHMWLRHRRWSERAPPATSRMCCIV